MSIQDKLLWIGCVIAVSLFLMFLSYLKKKHIGDFRRPMSWILIFAICCLVAFM